MKSQALAGTELAKELLLINSCAKSPHKEILRILTDNKKGLSEKQLSKFMLHTLQLKFKKTEIKKGLNQLLRGGLLLKVNEVNYFNIERAREILALLKELGKKNIYFESL